MAQSAKQENHEVPTATRLGHIFAAAALKDAQDIQTFAESVKASHAHEDFDAMTEYRTQFIEGAQATGYMAGDKLWSRVWLSAKAFGFLGDYPKSTKAPAAKKAAQREAAATKAKAVTNGKSPMQLVAESKKLLAAGKTNEAADLLVAAKKAQQEADARAKKEVTTHLADLKKHISVAVEHLIKAGDVKALERLAAAADKAIAETKVAA